MWNAPITISPDNAPAPRSDVAETSPVTALRRVRGDGLGRSEGGGAEGRFQASQGAGRSVPARDAPVGGRPAPGSIIDEYV